MEPQRQKIVVANWKMNKTIAETRAFIQQLAPILLTTNSKVAIAVPFTALREAALAASNSPLIIGAQNIHSEENGPYTGEISAEMVREAGGRFVIIGHSERRQQFQENNQCVNKKIKMALQYELQPLLCIGESWEIRQGGNSAAFLKRQLQESLQGLNPEQLTGLMIAYEPLWAIGSGHVATLEIIQEVHRFCRQQLQERWGREAAEQIAILYGGSVIADNSRSLLGDAAINGVLVGGASLEIKSFCEIVNSHNLLRSSS